MCVACTHCQSCNLGSDFVSSHVHFRNKSHFQSLWYEDYLSNITNGNNQSTFPRIDPRLDVDMSGPAWERKIFSTKYLELFLCETILNTHIFTKFTSVQFTHKDTASYSTKSARSLFLWCDQSLFFHDDKGGKQHVWKHAEKKRLKASALARWWRLLLCVLVLRLSARQPQLGQQGS